MATKIGHASKDERSKITGGSAGDQTCKEVCIRDWYLHDKGWVVLRCKDASKRAKIAEAMEKACANDDIGYDQNQRDSLFNNIKGFGWDPSKTTKAVETDCSALVRVCIAYAYGADKAGNIRTISEPATLVNTGLFEKLTSDQYCKSSDYLLRGDILCTPCSGHTVVCLEDGAKVKSTTSSTTNKSVKATEAAKSFSKSLDSKYEVTAKNSLNVRYGAGGKKKLMTSIPSKKEVRCYGYYTTVLGRKWLYIQFTQNGVQYTGFASSKYLKKKK